MALCPVCDKRAPNCDTKAIYTEDGYAHRICAMKKSGEYALIEGLFEMQDDFDVDPTTAMADLIGQLGHFATERNKRKRGGKRIDFEESARRGLNYYREECL